MSTQTVSTSERQSEIQMGQHIDRLESENAMLRRVIGAQRYLHEFFDRYGFNQKDVKEKLAGCSETNNVWLAVQVSLEYMIRAEQEIIGPGLSNEDLRWYAARARALKDFKASLYELWALANQPIKAA